jgi:hypothetical protein
MVRIINIFSSFETNQRSARYSHHKTLSVGALY